MASKDDLGSLDADSINEKIFIPPTPNRFKDREEFDEIAREYIWNTMANLPENKTYVVGMNTINKRENTIKTALRVSSKLIRVEFPKHIDIGDNAYLHFELGLVSKGIDAIHQFDLSAKNYDWLIRSESERANPLIEENLGRAYFFLATSLMNAQDPLKDNPAKPWKKYFQKAYAHLENSKETMLENGDKPSSFMEILLEESKQYLSTKPIQLHPDQGPDFPKRMLN